MTSRYNSSTFLTRHLLTAALAIPLICAENARGQVASTGIVSPNPLFSTAQDDLFVGHFNNSQGTIDITLGGIVVSRNGAIRGSGSRVTVAGGGSSWLMFGDLEIGRKRDSSLLILDGGLVTNQDARLGGSFSLDVGMVLVDGVGSNWINHGNLFIGGESYGSLANGTVTITNGGEVNVDGLTFIGDHPANNSYIYFENGTLNTHAGIAPTQALRGTGTINADIWLLSGDYTLNSAADLPTAFTLDQRIDQNIAVNLSWSTPLDQFDYFGIDDGNLVMQAGMAVTSVDGHIRYSDGTTSGTMTVDDPGTSWTVSRELYVGNRGMGELHITDGGSVVLSGTQAEQYHNFQVGYESGGNGRILVDGAGSVLDSSNSGLSLDLGYQGEGHLVVQNGGAAHLRSLQLSQGSVLVDGVGSLLTSESVYVEPSGVTSPIVSPHLTLSGGAEIQSGSAYISGDDDLVVSALVDGLNTNWAVSGTLRVGSGGVGALEVTNGAALSSGDAILGQNSYGNGTTSLSVVASTWMNQGNLTLGDDGDAILVISDGGAVTVGGTLTVAPLLISTPGSYVELDNGTLTIDEGFLTAATVLGIGTLNTNTFLLEGTHTLNDFSELPSTMQVAIQPGQNITVNARWEVSSGNRFDTFGVDGGDVTLADSFQVRSYDGYVGYTQGVSGQMTLTGSGTVWTVSALTIGQYGDGTLRINDGAVLDSSFYTYLGDKAGTNGSLIISGPGAHFNADNGYSIDVGRYGNGAVLVENGGIFSTNNVYLGKENAATGLLTVTGVGSAWHADDFVFVGGDDTGMGVINILDGGQASFEGIRLGSDDAPLSGLLNIDGPGSRAVATLNGVYSGGADSTRIVITNGGALEAMTDSRLNGEALIDGTNSRWTMEEDFRVGSGYAGLLTITNGGEVVSGDAYVGYNENSAGSNTQGHVVVDGADSQWTVSGLAWVGGDFYERDNEGQGLLTVSNGAAVNVTGVLYVDDSVVGSLVTLDNGTLNLDTALVLAGNITGTGVINADYWLISGNHTISDFSTLPTQLILDQQLGQNITINLTWSDPARSFAFFGVDEGNVVLNSGLAIQSLDGYLAHNFGSTGALTLDGMGTRWDIAEDLYVGYNGDGTLRVQNDAALTVGETIIGRHVGANGLLQVRGAGTTYSTGEVYVGRLGTGELRLEEGAQLSLLSPFNDSIWVGDAFGASGSVLVHGAGSQIADFFNLVVGKAGTGSLSIEAGASVTSTGFLYVGDWADGVGSVVVDGAGSYLETDTTRIGNTGMGSLEIRNGATANIASLRLGASSSQLSANGEPSEPSGSVHVHGAGSVLDIGFVFSVGYAELGSLEVSDGGTVTADDSHIGRGSFSSGEAIVHGSGSTWQMSGDLVVGYATANASLDISDGGLVTSTNATVRGDGVVRGANSTWTTSNNFSLLSGGAISLQEAGVLVVGGDFILNTSATLTISIGELAPSSIIVEIDAVLSGNLVLEATANADLELGDSFLLLDIAGDRVGGFSNAIENQIVLRHQGIDLLLSYGVGDGNDIGLTTALAGDLNADGLANGADLEIILTRWGQNVTPAQRALGDLDPNGMIDQADLLLAPQALLELGGQIEVLALDGEDPEAFDAILEGETVATHNGIDILFTYIAGDGDDIGLFAELAGDVDGDESVSATDLDVLFANWGGSVGVFDRAAGDLSGDGIVGEADLQLVLANWGNNASNTGTVPEPASIAILGLGAFAYIRRRQSRVES